MFSYHEQPCAAISKVTGLVRRNMKIYKIQTMMNPGTVDHVK